MKVLVTGAAGVVGSVAVQRLREEGHEVVGVDTKGEGVHQCSTTDFEELKRIVVENKPAAIVHLVAVSFIHGIDQQDVFRINTTSVYNVLTLAEEFHIERVVVASSINAIGAILSKTKRFKYFPVDEDHPLEPEDSYSLSKQVGENIADAFARRNSWMSIVSLRFHAVLDDKSQALPQAEKMGNDISGDLWGYVLKPYAIGSILKALGVTWKGHKAFFIVAPDNAVDKPSHELYQTYFPHVTLKQPLTGTQGFFNCEKAKRLLNWEHP
ncbi:hypothetical protein TRICI_004642 [Trichomonascus ciferrii]|uniref:NAD-dependent epimerase/dehydratase domain-containing protein n=1 Tax=Trichomonascus ciferrii TaxID=44093 RepID=A0A642UZR5_9ASCO|nr:hypothetical protein TRICI_004642 [Trichomonascus ciferrii]